MVSNAWAIGFGVIAGSPMGPVSLVTGRLHAADETAEQWIVSRKISFSRSTLENFAERGGGDWMARRLIDGNTLYLFDCRSAKS